MGIIDMILNNRRARDRLVRGETVEWIERNPKARYIRQLLLSTPPWVKRSDLRALQRRAQWETVMCHEVHHVGHIVPLNHPRVCGLTVPANLRVEPGDVNMRRGNTCPEVDGQLDFWPT